MNHSASCTAVRKIIYRLRNHQQLDQLGFAFDIDVGNCRNKAPWTLQWNFVEAPDSVNHCKRWGLTNAPPSIL